MCEEAFDDNRRCVCTHEGSDAYFDRHMGQWYPGDDPEYEVSGYGEYLQTIICFIVSELVNYGVEHNSELVEFVTHNLDDICDELYISSEDKFSDMSIDRYIWYGC